MRNINPFQRYLNPRASGLIVFGGGGGGPGAGEITSSVMAQAGPRFDSLASGQTDIRGDISGVSGQVSGVSGQVSNLGDSMTKARGELTSGFTNLNDYLGTEFEKARLDRFDKEGARAIDFFAAAKQAEDNFNALNTAVGGVDENVVSGFDAQTERFNTLDNSVSGVQDTVDTGFETASNRLDSFRDNVTEQFGAADTRLGEVNDALSEQATTNLETLQGDVSTTQANLLEGQGGLQGQLNDLTANQDLYYEDLSGNQAAMLENQTNYASNFDDYLTRYGENTTLQNQALGDLQGGLTSLGGGLGDAVNSLSGNISGTTEALSNQITDTNNTVSDIINGGFNTIGETMQGGFQEATAAQQGAQETFSSSLDTVRSLLESGNAAISGELAASMKEVGSAFDAQGNLITSGFDEQGNQISRSFDAQGNLITTTTDANGQQISQVSTNVQDVLNQAKSLGQSMDTGFGNLSSQNSGLMSEVGNTNQSITNIGDLLTKGFGQTNNKIGNVQADTQQLVSQAPAYMKSLAQMSNIPTEMRQQFYQLGNSFDQQGNLISNSIDAQGNTLTRSMDNMGNVIIKKFDPLGQALGNMRVSLSDTFNAINSMSTLPGAAAGMGNLSPAMQDLGEGVSASGFGSPYYMTQ